MELASRSRFNLAPSPSPGIEAHRRASCRLPLAAVGRHSRLQPISAPQPTSQQQPSKKRATAPCTQPCRPQRPTRRVASQPRPSLARFCLPPSFGSFQSILHHHHARADHSFHPPTQPTHLGPSPSRDPTHRQDAEMQVPQSSIAPPKPLLTVLASALLQSSATTAMSTSPTTP